MKIRPTAVFRLARVVKIKRVNEPTEHNGSMRCVSSGNCANAQYSPDFHACVNKPLKCTLLAQTACPFKRFFIDRVTAGFRWFSYKLWLLLFYSITCRGRHFVFHFRYIRIYSNAALCVVAVCTSLGV
ncbi:hypothetical protein GDO78_009015 [Eleutherodactylus coqui]|uniref:Uncharacterized protein n=1 Tax=Eleutherodactylus coqui TaxID=57060 RepID=A0A8J6FGC7_ELECQ|nr:hypothetical protein GDO78_009015 [Eleutherodactylus coqui]